MNNHDILKGIFIHINTPDKLKNAVTRAIKADKINKKKQKSLQEDIFFKLDGKASLRAKNAIEKILKSKEKKHK